MQGRLYKGDVEHQYTAIAVTGKATARRNARNSNTPVMARTVTQQYSKLLPDTANTFTGL